MCTTRKLAVRGGSRSWLEGLALGRRPEKGTPLRTHARPGQLGLAEERGARGSAREIRDGRAPDRGINCPVAPETRKRGAGRGWRRAEWLGGSTQTSVRYQPPVHKHSGAFASVGARLGEFDWNGKQTARK